MNVQRWNTSYLEVNVNRIKLLQVACEKFKD